MAIAEKEKKEMWDYIVVLVIAIAIVGILMWNREIRKDM